ncbi:hypothetical protein JGH11_17490 [Dysgonomonas sp. Marseille-P4677]|uniref:hypothetical protein n=1 Tax=Dysgonomonas sp. Marseille-P4677 TaxID=2364790 RepID=UPI0019128B5E|nr:hypothetical protein [Dysgonomonas sp. Marseille-P4677]MBK5722672.1 hypothetical protein [Dysgonomonas sp. Marseille-P4677]
MRKIVLFILLCTTLLLHAQKKDITIRVVTPQGQPCPSIPIKRVIYSGLDYTDQRGYFTYNDISSDLHIVICSEKHVVIPITGKDSITVEFTPFINGYVKDSWNRIIKDIEVKLIEKDRTQTVKTDKDGYFSFRDVDINNEIILQFKDSKNWYQNKIIRQKYSFNQPLRIELDQYISPLLGSSTDTLGVVYLNNNTPTLSESSSFDYIGDIKSLSKSGNKYNIKKEKERSPSSQQFEYTGSFSISTIGRIPELQTDYAQGQALGGQYTWQGADKNQQFSWGPQISSLEYTDGNYAYDNNGALINKGLGNSIRANIYDPVDFFRTALSFNNSLSYRKTFIKKSILHFTLNQNKINSPIPNSDQEKYNGSLKIENMKTGKFSTSMGILGSIRTNHFMNNGANHSRLMHSIFTTPPTFDNSNGLKRNDAVNKNNSWQLSDGSMRSYAPKDVANPYYIVSKLPDKDKGEMITAYAKTEYKNAKFQTDASASYSYQWDDMTIGKISATPIETLRRKENISDLSIALLPSYRIEKYPTTITLQGGYTFNHISDEVKRMDVAIMDRLRNSNEISYGMRVNRNDFFFEVYNKHYFSNTVKEFTNLFPTVASKYNLRKLDFINDALYDLFDNEFIDYIGIRGSTSRSLSENPLVFRNRAVLSTSQNSTNALKTFYEDREILPLSHKMKPEIYQNSELGLELTFLRGKFYTELNYYNNTTHNMFSPVYTDAAFSVDNIGRLNNYGFLLDLTYYHNSGWGDNRFHGIFKFNFNRARNKVKSVYEGKEKIQLAGFSNIGTFFAKDEPLGVIYGSTYKRNDNGEMLIDNDGFPVKDPALKLIGDPTPNYIMNLSANLGWRRFSFMFNFEYSNGGDRWNGTQAYLDYLGMSETSASLRNTRGHIFDGVLANGNRNSKSVDFYDVSLPIDQNRWVRYGADGVGEEYIQDASYLRLSNISLSYLLVKRNQSRFFEDVSIGIQAENLLFFSSYKGVDPSSTLFGYSTGKGLDLFNSPAIKRYSLSVTLKF